MLGVAVVIAVVASAALGVFGDLGSTFSSLQGDAPASATASVGEPANFDCAQRSFKIYFDKDLSEMTSTATDVADQAAKVFAVCGAQRIALSGHSDGREASGPNPEVSSLRVNTVQARLVAQGVPASAIAAEDKGFTEPMVPTEPSESEPLNRFVSVEVE